MLEQDKKEELVVRYLAVLKGLCPPGSKGWTVTFEAVPLEIELTIRHGLSYAEGSAVMDEVKRRFFAGE